MKKHSQVELLRKYTYIFWSPRECRIYDLPGYRLDALATELRRTLGEQCRKLGSLSFRKLFLTPLNFAPIGHSWKSYDSKAVDYYNLYHRLILIFDSPQLI